MREVVSFVSRKAVLQYLLLITDTESESNHDKFPNDLETAH